MYNCANCGKMGCAKGDEENLPKICPTREKESQKEIAKIYHEEENFKIAYNSSLVEAEGYCEQTRIEETIRFFKKCKYKKIGIAFCAGLRDETKQLKKILDFHGFEVVSIMCKNGAIPKSELGFKDEHIISGNIMCNPIGQAHFLNKANVDYTIIFGLCVGHDSLAIKYLDSPVTVLAVKDRVMGHNPMAALYLSNRYYKKKIFFHDEEEG